MPSSGTTRRRTRRRRTRTTRSGCGRGYGRTRASGRVAASPPHVPVTCPFEPVGCSDEHADATRHHGERRRRPRARSAAGSVHPSPTLAHPRPRRGRPGSGTDGPASVRAGVRGRGKTGASPALTRNCERTRRRSHDRRRRVSQITHLAPPGPARRSYRAAPAATTEPSRTGVTEEHMSRHRSSRAVFGALCSPSPWVPAASPASATTRRPDDSGQGHDLAEVAAADRRWVRARGSRASRPPTRCWRSPARPRRPTLELDPRPQRRARDGEERARPAARARRLRRAGLDAGQAAKLIVLVDGAARPVVHGLRPPGDGAQNLVATLDAGLQPNGSYGLFNATLYAAIAKKALGGARCRELRLHPGRAAGQRRLELHRAARRLRPRHRHHGTGDPGPGRGARAADRPDLSRASCSSPLSQQPTGAWQSFGADDPNSTSTAILAITAAGFDASTPCWRDTVAPIVKGKPYANPLDVAAAQPAPTATSRARTTASGINTFAPASPCRHWSQLAPVRALTPRSC